MDPKDLDDNIDEGAEERKRMSEEREKRIKERRQQAMDLVNESYQYFGETPESAAKLKESAKRPDPNLDKEDEDTHQSLLPLRARHPEDFRPLPLTDTSPGSQRRNSQPANGSLGTGVESRPCTPFNKEARANQQIVPYNGGTRAVRESRPLTRQPVNSTSSNSRWRPRWATLNIATRSVYMPVTWKERLRKGSGHIPRYYNLPTFPSQSGTATVVGVEAGRAVVKLRRMSSEISANSRWQEPAPTGSSKSSTITAFSRHISATVIPKPVTNRTVVTPESTPESSPESTPESSPEPTPESSPESTPDSTPEPQPSPAVQKYERFRISPDSLLGDSIELDIEVTPTASPIMSPTPAANLYTGNNFNKAKKEVNILSISQDGPIEVNVINFENEGFSEGSPDSNVLLPGGTLPSNLNFGGRSPISKTVLSPSTSLTDLSNQDAKKGRLKKLRGQVRKAVSRLRQKCRYLCCGSNCSAT